MTQAVGSVRRWAVYGMSVMGLWLACAAGMAAHAHAGTVGVSVVIGVPGVPVYVAPPPPPRAVYYGPPPHVLYAPSPPPPHFVPPGHFKRHHRHAGPARAPAHGRQGPHRRH